MTETCQARDPVVTTRESDGAEVETIVVCALNERDCNGDASTVSSLVTPSDTRSASASASVAADVWSKEQQHALEVALSNHPVSTFSGTPNERWERIAEAVPGKTRSQCLKRYKELTAAVKKKKADEAAGEQAATSTAHDSVSSACTSSSPPPAAPHAALEDDWTEEAFNALLKAEKKHPATDYPGRQEERFAAISERVAGKTPSQCKKLLRDPSRFRQLQAMFAARKVTATASTPPPPPLPQQESWRTDFAEELAEEWAVGRSLRVSLVRNHSTYLEGLWPILQALQLILSRPEMGGFKKIMPAQIRRLACVPRDKLTITITEETPTGYRLTARKGRMEQLIFVTVNGTANSGEIAPRNQLSAAIDEVLGEGTDIAVSAVTEEDGPASQRAKSAVELTDEEVKQRLLQRYGTERQGVEADAVLEASVGPASKDANRGAAAQLELERRRNLKAKHERDKAAMAAAEEEKKVVAATRKLRAIKGCMDSTTHTGSAAHLDSADKNAQKALVRAHAEDAAARRRY